MRNFFKYAYTGEKYGLQMVGQTGDEVNRRNWLLHCLAASRSAPLVRWMGAPPTGIPSIQH